MLGSQRGIKQEYKIVSSAVIFLFSYENMQEKKRTMLFRKRFIFLVLYNSRNSYIIIVIIYVY